MRHTRCLSWLWLPLALGGAAHAAPPAKWTITLPDAGTYSYWVQAEAGSVAVLPTTASHKAAVPLPASVAAGDTLYVLDAHTGQVAAKPLAAPGTVTLAVADFKPLTGPAPPPATVSAPPPAAPVPEQRNGLGEFFSWLFGLAVAAGVLWVLWRLYQTRGAPLIQLARRVGVDVPDPKPLDPQADAPPPVYEAPKPRPIERIPDEAGAVPPPRPPRHSTPAPPLRGAGEAAVPQLVGTQGLAAGSTFALVDGTVTVGRDGDNGIVLAESTVSRCHARLVREEGGVTLIDEGSANGVYVNGDRVQQATLAHGDEIKIGDNFFRFEA